MKGIATDLEATAHANMLIAEHGPLGAPGVSRRIAPILPILGCALVTMLLNPDANDRRVVFAALLLVCAVACGLALPWRRLPRSGQGLLPVLVLIPVDILMHATGGSASYYLILMLVPPIWLALYERRLWLHLGLALATGELALQVLTAPFSRAATLQLLLFSAVSLTLLPVLRHVVNINRAALLAVYTMANIDPLTGLFNRRGLDARIEDRRARHPDGFGMIFLDLDRFKRINDLHGHECGDELLAQVSQRLAESVRKNDVVARTGGDEFVVACNSSRLEVARLADRIRDCIKSRPFQLGEQLVPVTASVGFSHMSAQPSDTTELLHEADLSMYLDKREVKEKERR